MVPDTALHLTLKIHSQVIWAVNYQDSSATTRTLTYHANPCPSERCCLLHL
uniref:Uncharacterized protein n=1 Tax=Arundo donax TaxID=35708 RepID=A0A0A8YNF2_ARUDO